MKQLNGYILEKLKKKVILNDFIKDKEIRLFKKWFSGLSDKDANMILDKYVYGWPLGEDIKNKSLCTAFELLFTLAAMLIDDNVSWKRYHFLGYKNYSGKNNPYDFSWFEEEIRDDYDYLDACKDWITNNIEEFKKIYDLCKNYPNDLNLKKIFYVYDRVFNATNE